MTASQQPTGHDKAVDPMKPLDVAADRLFGPIAQQPPTEFGRIILTGLRRASVLAAVEIFGTDDQRRATHALMDRRKAQP